MLDIESVQISPSKKPVEGNPSSSITGEAAFNPKSCLSFAEAGDKDEIVLKLTFEQYKYVSHVFLLAPTSEKGEISLLTYNNIISIALLPCHYYYCSKIQFLGKIYMSGELFMFCVQN